MSMHKPKIVAIVGPTASGKTGISIELASRFNGEIVSADSRQIYRGMDIGTGKATAREQKAVPHHLIDIRNPNEEYSVADFKKDAGTAIDEIILKKKLPFLVGGTGLYIKTVIENLAIPSVKADPTLRLKLEKEIADDGLASVYKKLLELDPDAEGVVDPKNPRRVIRALEVAITSGAPFTSQRKKYEPAFDALTIGIALSPEILRERINIRVDAMIKNGLVKETEKLLDAYGEVPALHTIGYKEIIMHLRKIISLDEAVQMIKSNTWQYARRQMTWFRKDPSIHWINAEDASALIQKFLAK